MELSATGAVESSAFSSKLSAIYPTAEVHCKAVFPQEQKTTQSTVVAAKLCASGVVESSAAAAGLSLLLWSL